ncbi:MAG: YdcF family protein [Thermoanaerobaculia bacterium]
MSWLTSWTRAVELLVIPPSGFVFLGLAGLALVRTRWRRLGLTLTACCALSFYLSSTPLIGEACLAALDRYPPIGPGAEASAEAVVILGAGTRRDASGTDAVTPRGRERLAAGAEIHRRSGKPVLVTGYSGRLMARELEQSFAVPVRWIEGESRTTHESAVLVAPLLRGDGVTRVILVTHFWHMPRATATFRYAGLEVTPAPMGFLAGDRGRPWRRVLPDGDALDFSAAAFHEWFGRLWYRLRYGY